MPLAQDALQYIFSGGVILLLLHISRQIGSVERGLKNHVEEVRTYRTGHQRETDAQFEAHKEQHHREEISHKLDH